MRVEIMGMLRNKRRKLKIGFWEIIIIRGWWVGGSIGEG